jgi:hypothetical protein
MAYEQDRFICALCEYPFGTRGQDDMRPCPRCGITQRTNANYRITVHVRSPGRAEGHRHKDFKREWRISRSISRDTGHVVGELRVIDRRENTYLKRMVDTVTGEVVYEREQPLGEHRNRGSARPGRQG